MKKRLINWYYNLLMRCEDVIGWVDEKVNRHRRRIDDRYWDEYIDPHR